MSKSIPYQPLVLRLLHGVNGIVAILAILTAFLVYNRYDGRLIKLPLPAIPDIIGIHGTFGLTFLILMPILVFYSFQFGSKRLIQADSLSRITQLNTPMGWYSWQRILNTMMLLASALALASGRMMKEEWLPAGELNHAWYYAHLSAWIVFVICTLLHIFLGLKVGGTALLTSMWNWQIRPEDSPKTWKPKIQAWFKNPRL